MPAAVKHTLSPADLAWMRVQRPENLAITTVALVCEQPIDENCLKSRIEDRLLARSLFRQRVASPHLSWIRPRWVEHEEFQLDDHFVRPSTDAEEHPESLDTFLSELKSQPLDETLPLWQVHLVRLADDRSAIVLRLHASIADSRAALDLALLLTDHPPDQPIPLTEIGLENTIPPHRILEDSARSASSTRTLCQLISSRSDRNNPLRAKPTGSKHLAWSGPVDLRRLDKQAAEHGVSAIEVLLAGVIGALRSNVHSKDVPTEDVRIRAVVPLNLRQDERSSIGTRLALGLMRLPLGGSTSSERLTAMTEALERLRLSSGQMAILGPDVRHGLSMTELEERSLRLLGKKATVSLGIADGPVDATTVCKQPLTEVLWWPADLGEISLGISIVTYAGSARFAVCLDASLDLDPQAMADTMASASQSI